MIKDPDVNNPALAAEYRAKADEYFMQGRSHGAADQRAIAKLAGYDKNKNWKAASKLCWSLYSESSEKAFGQRGEFWRRAPITTVNYRATNNELQPRPSGINENAEIAAPCSANWDQMTGDDKMRFCAECKLHVVSAAAMTDEEVLAALKRAVQGEEVCMKIYRRADGTFLTKIAPSAFNDSGNMRSMRCAALGRRHVMLQAGYPVCSP